MYISQFKWKIDIRSGMLQFMDGTQLIGGMKLKGVYKKSCYVNIKNSTYIIHSELLSKNRYRIYNSQNDRQLAVLELKFWRSEATLKYRFDTYLLKSKFLGILGNYWIHNKSENKTIEFSNHLVHGKVSTPVSNDEKHHLLIISAVQSMFTYSLLFLMAIIVVIIAIT